MHMRLVFVRKQLAPCVTEESCSKLRCLTERPALHRKGKDREIAQLQQVLADILQCQQPPDSQWKFFELHRRSEEDIISLAGAQVSAENCSKVIEAVVRYMLDVEIPLDSLPSECTVRRYADQAHILAKMQVADSSCCELWLACGWNKLWSQEICRTTGHNFCWVSGMWIYASRSRKCCYTNGNNVEPPAGAVWSLFSWRKGTELFEDLWKSVWCNVRLSKCHEKVLIWTWSQSALPTTHLLSLRNTFITM